MVKSLNCFKRDCHCRFNHLTNYKKCAASLDSLEKKQRRPSCSKDCGGWNIAATTARAWRCCTKAACLSARKKEKLKKALRACSSRNLLREISASATRAGPRTEFLRTKIL